MIIIHDISWLVGGVPMQTREGPEEGLSASLQLGDAGCGFQRM